MDMHSEIIADSASGARSLTDFPAPTSLPYSGSLKGSREGLTTSSENPAFFLQIDHRRES
jgi:hypothetical protein